MLTSSCANGQDSQAKQISPTAQLVAEVKVSENQDKNTKVKATKATGIRIPVNFTSPAKGFVSLALFDKQGVLVRSLLYAKPVEAGKQSVEWDGTNDLGVPLKAGQYSTKGVFFPALPTIKYLTRVGKSGNPSYRTPDGKGDWGANLGYGTSIVANSKILMMGWAAVEDNQITGVQQTDSEGTVQSRYFTFYPWDMRMAAAIDETNYYLGIYSFDKKTTEIAEYKIGEPRGKILAQLPVKAVPQRSGRWRGRETAYLDGLALDTSNLYATVAQENALFILNRTTGELRKKVDLPSPRGIVVSGNSLIVVSGTKVLALDLAGGNQTTIVADGVMQAPNAVAIDKAGNFYVGDSGADFVLDPEKESGSRQVYAFSPQGKLLRKLGKTDGSPRSGRFDKDGFGIIAALAIGPDGKLWAQDVATGFKRTSRWTLDGQLEKQWFNRKIQHVGDQVNPALPNELLSPRDIFDDSPPGLYAHTIDWQTGVWQPSWFYELTVDDAYRAAKGVFVSHEHGGNPLKLGHPDRTWPIFDMANPSFVTYQGRNYLMSTDGNGEGSIFTYSADKAPKPVALVSFHRAEKRDGVIHGFYDNGPNNWFTWADRDGNGKMSPSETNFTEKPANLESSRRVYSAKFEPNLDIRLKLLTVVDKKAILKDVILPLKELLTNGTPVYDWASLREIPQLQVPDLRGGDGTKDVGEQWVPSPVETKDAQYGIVDSSPSQKLRLPGIDGEGWWASRNWRKKLVKWDKNGQVQWAVGRRAAGRAKPGEMYNPIMLAGEANNALFVADAMAVVWVWNTDGFYLGRLYHDTGSGEMDADRIYIEQQGTQIYTDPKTGKIYSIANDTGAAIHEVSLPKQTPVVGSPVNLSPAQLPQILAWDPESVPPTDKPNYVATPTKNPVTVNGELDGREGWDGEMGKLLPRMQALLDGEELAKVSVMYDDQNLYLGYQVRDANGPANSGSELPYAPFVSGAYVDFTIGTNWKGPREQVQAGDVRVLVARLTDGKLFQRGFWPIKPSGTNPQTITSPAAQIKFDDIAEVPGLQAAYKLGEKDARTGLTPYTVEIAVPLASLGLANPVGKTVGFDLSVATSNQAGNGRNRAAHWGGLSEGVVVDRPGSAMLLPRTWGTLTFSM